jgi:catechol 2,3-dioxygenase-like lactoylglutathione lyase family enzyme
MLGAIWMPMAAEVIAAPQSARDWSVVLTTRRRVGRTLQPWTGQLARRGYGAGMDFKLELVPVPVTDVDRAKAFYVDQVGFAADVDVQVSEGLRFVQLTPPGSACSIVIGTGITEMAPGSQKGLQVVVADIEAAREYLLGRGVEVGDVDKQDWGSFVYFSDPDGNTWSVQQLPERPEDWS